MSENLSDRLSYITLFGLLREISQWSCVFWKQHRLTSVPDNADLVDRNLSTPSQLPSQLPELQDTIGRARNKDKNLKPICTILPSPYPTHEGRLGSCCHSILRRSFCFPSLFLMFFLIPHFLHSTMKILPQIVKDFFPYAIVL